MLSPVSPLRQSISRSDGGNIAILSALILPVAVLFFGLVLDQAAYNLHERKVQSAVDMAAISAASDIDAADTLARAVLRDNGITLTTERLQEARTLRRTERAISNVKVEKGQYTPDIALAAADRFKANALPYNAVRVSVRDEATRAFNPLKREARHVRKSATATIKPQVAFTLGSRLASFDAGLANDLLSGLTGSEVNLTLMDYRALIDADVSVLSFLDALAVEADLTALTYTDILEAEVTLGHVATALDGLYHGDSAHLHSFRHSDKPLTVARMIDLGPIAGKATGSSALTAEVGIMEIFSAAAMLANGGSMIDLELGTDLPGLASINLTLAIGEPAQEASWFSFGPSGIKVKTVQTRLRVKAQIGTTLSGDDALINLPVYVDIASAEAALSNAGCAYHQPSRSHATIATKPSVLQLALGEATDAAFADFDRPLKVSETPLIDASLVTVSASAYATMSNSTLTPLYFSADDITNRRVKTAETTQYTEILTQSLIDNLDMEVETLGLLSLNLPGAIKPVVSDALSAVTPTLDNLLYAVLEPLGLSLGEADVRVRSVDCQMAMLVE